MWYRHSNEDENGVTTGVLLPLHPLGKSRLMAYEELTHWFKKKKKKRHKSITVWRLTHFGFRQKHNLHKVSPPPDRWQRCMHRFSWMATITLRYSCTLSLQIDASLSCTELQQEGKKGFHLLPRTLLLIIFHVSLSLVFIGTFHFDSHRAPRWCNLIPAHWCMQCFKAALWKLYVSLGERRASVMYASLENQCKMKRNMSWVLASLWINVHSVKKINWINSINSPQRCRSSLHRSISSCIDFVFKKINICHVCTELRCEDLK